MAPSSEAQIFDECRDVNGSGFRYGWIRNEWWRFIPDDDGCERTTPGPRTQRQPMFMSTDAIAPVMPQYQIASSIAPSPGVANTPAAGIADFDLTSTTEPVSGFIPRTPPILQVPTSPPPSFPGPSPHTAREEVRKHNRAMHEMVLVQSKDAGKLSYRRRKDPKAFFTYGKVFVSPWTEQVGNGSELGSSSITTSRYGLHAQTKFRRFVVIIEGQSSCVALPISTYSGRGVATPWIRKDDHSIIYTGRLPPQPMPDEIPRGKEPGMLEHAIRVNTDDRTDALLGESRLNYSKLCTISHTTPVKRFGVVHDQSLSHLRSQLQKVLNRIKKGKRAESNVSAVSLPFPSSLMNNPKDQEDVVSHLAVLKHRRTSSQSRTSPADDRGRRSLIVEAIMQMRECSRFEAEAMLDAEVASSKRQSFSVAPKEGFNGAISLPSLRSPSFDL